jgi:hypothetical protein
MATAQASQTVSVFDPQGNVRSIPADQLDAALRAGGTRAVKMSDPQGTARWVRDSDVDAATRAGGKVVDASSSQRPSAVSRFSRSAAESSGLSTVGNALAHPIDTVGTVVDAGRRIVSRGQPARMADNPNPIISSVGRMVDNTTDNARQAYSDYKSGNPAGAVSHAVSAVPVIGPALDRAEGQYADKDYAGEMGTLTGTVGAVGAPKVIKSAVEAAPVAARAAGRFSGAAKDRLYPQPNAIPANEMAARNLAKALVVPTQAMPNFVGAATDEAGTVLDHAKRNNIPINSTLDFAKAAKGASDEVRGFYSDKVLKPHADRAVSVEGTDYRGKNIRDGQRATLGDINDRIDAINQELNPNYRKALPSQTNAANVSDADLLAEKRALTNVLHQQLGQMNGIDPQAVADLRVRAGKLKTIADEAGLSANTDTTAAGKAARGRSDIPTGKMGIIERGVQAVQGGPEVIGNRQLKSALQDIEPKSTPMPDLKPSTQTPDQIAGAQQEFLRANQLEQGAQDAAAGRGATAQAVRQNNGAADLQQRMAEGAALRDVGRSRFARLNSPAQSDVPDAPSSSGTPQDQLGVDYPDLSTQQPASAPPPTIQDQTVVPANDAEGIQKVTLPVVVPPSQPIAAAPSPETHHFDPAQWLEAYPNGDVDAATAQARQLGYDVAAA